MSGVGTVTASADEFTNDACRCASRVTGPEIVSTWADGFGRWHARVQFPEPGYGRVQVEREADRVRARARRAIRRELAAREKLGPGWKCRVQIVDAITGPGLVMRSITYAERVK